MGTSSKNKFFHIFVALLFLGTSDTCFALGRRHHKQSRNTAPTIPQVVSTPKATTTATNSTNETNFDYVMRMPDSRQTLQSRINQACNGKNFGSMTFPNYPIAVSVAYNTSASAGCASSPSASSSSGAPNLGEPALQCVPTVFRIPSNCRISFPPNSAIYLKPTADDQDSGPNISGAKVQYPAASRIHAVFLIVDKTNVTLDGVKIYGDSSVRCKLKSSPGGTDVCYSDSISSASSNIAGANNGEWGMGIWIAGSSQVTVKNASISKMWGDAVFIGSRAGTTPRLHNSKILVSNLTADKNGRQGISLEDGIGVRLENLKVTNTNRTAPAAAVDIEPPSGTDELQDIVIDGLLSENNHVSGVTNGCGLGIELSNMRAESAGKPRVVDIQASGLYSQTDTLYLRPNNHKSSNIVGCMSINGRWINDSGQWALPPGSWSSTDSASSWIHIGGPGLCK